MIVRELVTKLSFDVDRKGIESFNRSIVGFKTRFALATTAVTGFVAGFIKSVSAVSDAVLDMEELSKSTGISTEKLIGLQRVASQFRINQNQFESSLVFLNDQIRQAEQGFGSLREDATIGGFELFDANNIALPVEQVLKNILTAISKVESETARFLLAGKLLGNQRFASLATPEGIRQLDKSDELGISLAKTFAESTENARIFNQELTKLSESFKDFSFKVFPPIIAFTADFFKELNTQIKNVEEGTFLEKLFKSIEEDAKAFDRLLGVNQPPRFPNSAIPNNGNIDVNTTVNVTVPRGTSEEQTAFLENSAQESFNEMFINGMQKIAKDFPTTE